MASQPKPQISSDDVERVVRRDFPTTGAPEALAMLGEYGRENWQREPDRVRLAVLKLANGSVERLRHEIESAKHDYRDVLAAAEYPGYMKLVPRAGSLEPEVEQRIIDDDWRQYQDWLTR